jgi:hypothetical protein
MKSSSLEKSGAVMPDGFGLLHLVGEPILERVAREERIARDHPRKRRDEKGERSREECAHDAGSPDDTGEQENPMSSNHIDLRI